MRYNQIWNMKRTGLFLIVVVMSSCAGLLDSSYGEYERENTKVTPGKSNMPSEPGKCYAKCLAQDEYGTFEEDIFVYTGSDEDQERVTFETIVIEPARTKWEKKKAENCLQKDENDCLVWCLVEIPETSKDFLIVKDTNFIKDFKIETISYAELVKSGGYAEWKEVVCESDISPDLYRRIQEALIKEGFLTGIEADGRINQKTKEALVKYQKKNNLPIGSLDLETLSHLISDFEDSKF